MGRQLLGGGLLCGDGGRGRGQHRDGLYSEPTAVTQELFAYITGTFRLYNLLEAPDLSPG